MNPHIRAVAFCALLAVPLSVSARPPRSVALADIAKNPSLIGKRVALRACIAIPLFDSPDGGEEYVLLYPCGAKLGEDPPEGLIAATFASEKVGQPFADAKITFEGEVQADFTGKLAWRQVDDRDREKHFVLTIDTVANPMERLPED